MYRKAHFFSLFLCCLFSLSAFAQGIQTEFGKNRIQYEKMKWEQYETPNFVVYWYEGGRPLGEFVLQIAERDNLDLQSILEYKINEKVQILVYNDLNDLKQSNAGLTETIYNTGGVSRIIGNKMVVHFNGDHNDLRKQIREGITQIYLNRMMFGGNLQEIVQNAVLLNLPHWFTSGLVAYVGEDWSTEKDNLLRDGILSGKYTSFFDLIHDNPELAGHSLWYYIGQNYGQSTVANLLYLTRINRSVESGFLYVLGSTFRQTTESWFDFYYQRYKGDELKAANPTGTALPLDFPDEKEIQQIRMAPSGNYLTFLSNDAGKFRVMIRELKRDGQTSVILKDGMKNTIQIPEDNYPLIAWSPKGSKLSVLYEKNNSFHLFTYNPRSGKSEKKSFKNEFDRITSMAFSSNSQLVVTAIKNGQSDLFTMNVSGKNIRNLTRDAHDDKNAFVVDIDGRRGVVFSSNRDSEALDEPDPPKYLEPKQFDLYFLQTGEQPATSLVRITNTPFANEHSVAQYDSTHLTYLSDENGIYNRYTAYLDTAIAYYENVVILQSGEELILPADSIPSPDEIEIDTTFQRPIYTLQAFANAATNYNRNILDQSISYRKKRSADLFLQNGKYVVYLNNFTEFSSPELSNTGYRLNTLNEIEESQKTPVRPINNLLDSIPTWQIPEEFEPEPADDPLEAEPIKIDTTTIEEVPEIPAQPEDPQEEPVEEEPEKIDIDNYFFQSDFEDNETPAAVIVEDEFGEVTLQNPATLFREFIEPKYEPIEFNSDNVKPYVRKFKMEYLTVQLDNSLLFDKRDNYLFEDLFYTYPDPGILFKGSIMDLHEDYRLQAGVRIPVTFDGVEYFVTFDDRKKRLDKRYSYYRRSRSLAETNRTVSNYLETRLSWPLNLYTSVRGSFLLRTDRLTPLSTDRGNLEAPVINQQRIGFMLEYVYDNTKHISVNIRQGTRFKVFGEMQKRFDLRLFESETNFDLSFNDGFLHVVGFDARHYQRIDRFSIIAARLAFASSFGAEKNLYVLGGVDNWIFAEANTEIPVPISDEFAYETLASNMRGFRNNIRNGNSYAVFNLEGRFPIFNYLSRTPVKSSFLRNFQVLLFFDAGTAWQGLSPFEKDNPLNTVLIGDPNSPVSVEVNYFRNPIVYGFGGGVRALVLGYFIRLDYAWGLETGVLQDGQFYFSLGKDF